MQDMFLSDIERRVIEKLAGVMEKLSSGNVRNIMKMEDAAMSGRSAEKTRKALGAPTPLVKKKLKAPKGETMADFEKFKAEQKSKETASSATSTPDGGGLLSKIRALFS